MSCVDMIEKSFWSAVNDCGISILIKSSTLLALLPEFIWLSAATSPVSSMLHSKGTDFWDAAVAIV